MPGEHFYTTDPKGELAPVLGYQREGIACFVMPHGSAGGVPLHRYGNGENGDHFYTVNQAEGDEAVRSGGYTYETIAGWVNIADYHHEPRDFHRWYNPENGDHFYTVDPNGELAPTLGYVYEGVACRVSTREVVPARRFYRWMQSGFGSNYTFEDGYSDADRLKIMERHTFGFYRASLPSHHLDPGERLKLCDAYLRAIHHELMPDEDYIDGSVCGEAPVNGDLIRLTRRCLDGNFKDFGDTLIHEMMHAAGYDHTEVRGSPEYATSAPMRATQLMRADDRRDPFGGV